METPLSALKSVIRGLNDESYVPSLRSGFTTKQNQPQNDKKKKLLRNEGVTSCREIAMPILTCKVNLIECR